jgi:tetratricopeptide (TPR) repeat protein
MKDRMMPSPQTSRDLAQAEMLWRSGRRDEAERACRALLAVQPQEPAALHLLCHIRSQSDMREAEGLARQAAALAPDDAGIANTLGTLLYARGDAAGAEAAYGRAVRLQPNQAEAHHHHGLALRALGRAAEAMAAQRQAAALRPYPEALTQIGVMLAAEDKPADALARFDAALALKPDYFDALYYRGVSLTTLQRHAEAEAGLRAALALRPQSPEALHALGAALNYLNREAEALAAFERAIMAAPGYRPAHIDYNALAFTMGRKELVCKSFVYARQRIGEDPALLLAEAEQRLQLHELAPAEALLRRAGQLAPERADIAGALGRAVSGQGRFDEAAILFEQALAREPHNNVHRREKGLALLRGGRAAEAALLLEDAVRLAPADQGAMALLTLAWREVGDGRHGEMTDMDTYVRAYDLPPPPGFTGEDFNRLLAEELSRLHTSKVEPHNQTLRGGTQTLGNLFGRGQRDIEALRRRIGEAVADYIARMPEAPSHPLFGRKRDGFAYAGSWSCRLSSSGFHTNHVHPQGWISSAYYVALPEVVQGPDQQGWIRFGQSNLGLGDKDRAFGAIQPAAGRLVLFPSYMWHGTIPFQSEAPRLTVAFDVVPV